MQGLGRLGRYVRIGMGQQVSQQALDLVARLVVDPGEGPPLGGCRFSFTLPAAPARSDDRPCSAS